MRQDGGRRGGGLLTYAEGATGRGATLGFALLVVLLGAYDGLVVGWLQWRVPRYRLPGLGREEWIGATMLGAVAAWILGVLPCTRLAPRAIGIAGPATPIEPALESLLALCMGADAGAVLAYLQAGVLERHGVRAGLWLPANALAQAIGRVVIFRAAASPLEAADKAGIAGWILLTLTLAGSLVGAVHGGALVFLLRPPPRDLTWIFHRPRRRFHRLRGIVAPDRHGTGSSVS